MIDKYRCCYVKKKNGVILVQIAFFPNYNIPNLSITEPNKKP